MWLVVEFPEDKFVEVVPEDWFNYETNKCWWPICHSTKITKMVQKLEAPNDPASGLLWKLYDARRLGNSAYGNYFYTQLLKQITRYKKLGINICKLRHTTSNATIQTTNQI